MFVVEPMKSGIRNRSGRTPDGVQIMLDGINCIEMIKQGSKIYLNKFAATPACTIFAGKI